MIFGSVCSGIEAASVAWEPLGWRPVFFAEIADFPSRVLAHHYPGVPNLGDFTTIGAKYGPVDVLVGGTPCQSFSTAGLRGGLDDERGALALEFCRLADRLKARWVVWENVPGALSVDSGRAFGSIIGALAQLGYGIAWRILDARHFGVPQRRRRLFLVGCLNASGKRAAAVLFEREGLRRDPPPGREARAEAPAGNAHGARSGSFYCLNDQEGSSIGVLRDVAPTLRAQMHGNIPAVIEPRLVSGSVAHTLTCHMVKSGDPSTDNYVIEPPPPSCGRVVGSGLGIPSPPGVLLPEPWAFSSKDYGGDASVGIAPTLRSGNFQASHANGGAPPAIAVAGRVRRLTPTECERLQGFPDGYTAIPGAKDGPRYAALGNSMAVPVMRWLGRRIGFVDSISEEVLA